MPREDIPPERRVLSDEMIEKRVVEILSRSGPMTTDEIERIMLERDDCRDSMAKHLAKMRYRGLIRGEISEEGRWLWSLPRETGMGERPAGR